MYNNNNIFKNIYILSAKKTLYKSITIIHIKIRVGPNSQA